MQTRFVRHRRSHGGAKSCWFESCLRVFVTNVVCAMVVGFACGVAVRAQEIGTTRVSVLFEEGQTYHVEIVTDATALAEKLEASVGRTLAADARPDRLQSVLTSGDEMFRRRFKLTFDESEMRPAIAYSVSPAVDGTSAPAATIRLTARIPAGATAGRSRRTPSLFEARLLPNSDAPRGCAIMCGSLRNVLCA